MSTDSPQVGVAIAGCGYWGMNYVRVFQETTGIRLVGVCDVRQERLDAVRQRVPSAFVTKNLTDLLAVEGLNAVVICTEATKHYSVALQCLTAGKHILVEKPLTVQVSESEELNALAEESNLVLMVGHTFIYNAAVRKLKEYVSAGADQLYYLYAQRTNLGPIRKDVNALWDLATHDIAIFNYLLEDTPEWVSAVGAKVLRNGREDVGFIALGYPVGVLAHIHVSWADPSKTREVVAVLADRRVVFDDLNGLEQIRVFEKGIRPSIDEPTFGYGEYQMTIRDGDIVSPKIGSGEPLKDQCGHFLECIESGARPLTGGREGIEVLRVLEAMDRSVLLQGTKVKVDKTVRCSRTIRASAA